MNKVMDFCFICDNGYVMPTAVAITSLIACKRVETEYRVHIVAADLDDDNEMVFKRMSCKGVYVDVLRCSAEALMKLHVYQEDTFCVATPAALLKFSLGDLFPDIDKIVYADGDVIFRKDVDDLYDIELGDNLVAAVPDSGKMYSNRPILHTVQHYFNSGVMLLNLKQMRIGGYAKRLLDAKRASTDASLMDQNIFNQVFDGHVLPLSIRYNCLFINLVRAYERCGFTFRHLNCMFATNYSDFEELVNDAAIIHYSSKDKPWKTDNIPLVELWDKAFFRSPFKQVSLSRVHSDGGVGFDFHKRAARPYGELIVSMTTYSARINVVHCAIESILEQTMKPDRIILWLAKVDFPKGEDEIPDNLKQLYPKGLQIRWVDGNLRSHKKYFYVLQEYPSAAVITVDDDLIYPPDLVERLYRSYERFPNCISAVRTHLMTFSDEGALNPYKTWPQVCVDYVNFPTLRLFATTGAGLLYPPGIMPKITFNDKVFMAICPNADDVWTKMMSVVAGIRVVNPCHDKCVLKQIPGSQECALWRANVLKNENDIQLDAVEQFCKKKLPKVGSVVSKIRNDSLSVNGSSLPLPWSARSMAIPKVSVIVVMSNTATYLDRCLSSLTHQSFKEIEIVCVDDGSTDSPYDILQRYYNADDRISVYWQTRRGLSAAHNTGLSKSRGEYVSFCRAEDFVSSDYVEKLLSCVRDGHPDVVLSGHKIFNNRRKYNERIFQIPSGFLNSAHSVVATSVGPMFYDGLDIQLGAMLLRRDFVVRQKDIFHDNFDCDITAAMILLANASSIAVINEAMYSRCPQLDSDRISRRDDFPCSLLDAFSAVRTNLDRNGVLKTLFPGYARVAIDACVDRLLGFISATAFDTMYRALRDHGIKDIGLDMAGPGDVGWSRYRLLCAIVDNDDPIRFVKEIMHQKAMALHDLQVNTLKGLNASQARCKELQNHRDQLKAKLKEAQEARGRTWSEREAMKAELQKVKAESAERVREAKAKLKEAQEARGRTWAEREAMKAELQRVKAESAAQVREAKAKLKEAQEARGRTWAERESMKAELQKVKTESAERVREAKAKLKEAQEARGRTWAERESMKAELQKVKAALKESQKRRGEIWKERELMKKNLINAQRMLAGIKEVSV